MPDFTRLAPTERQLWTTAPSTLADAIAEGVTGVIVTMFTAHENIRKVRDADRNVDDLLAELHNGDSVVAQAKQDKIQSDFLCSFYGSLAQLQQDVVVYNSASPLLLSSQIDRRDRRNKKAHTSSLGEGEEADKEDEELPTLWQAGDSACLLLLSLGAKNYLVCCVRSRSLPKGNLLSVLCSRTTILLNRIIQLTASYSVWDRNVTTVITKLVLLTSRISGSGSTPKATLGSPQQRLLLLIMCVSLRCRG